MTKYQLGVITDALNSLYKLTDWERRFIMELSRRNKYSCLRYHECALLNTIYWKVSNI